MGQTVTEKQEDKINRQDHALKKRVELQVYTSASFGMGVSTAVSYIKCASHWGHSAIAITDHSVAYALPSAYEAALRCGIKLIPGYVCIVLPNEKSSINDAFEITLLATNQAGLHNLYKLISISYNERPWEWKIPCLLKNKVEQYRDGLLIGMSPGCGEIIKAMHKGAKWDELRQITSFYDFLEVVPISNYEKDVENARNQIINVIRLGEEVGKPVAAVSNANMINPEEAVCYDIMHFNKGYFFEEHPRHLRTTEEMLAEFEFLGKEKAEEIVVDATIRIADRVEPIELLPYNHKGSRISMPEIPESEGTITTSVWEKARLLYGNTLPAPVEYRIQAELKCISAQNSWSAFMIAKMAVNKSNSDGFRTIGRGSIGSSFVAYLYGINEINPLPPHYVCPVCKCTIFEIKDEQNGADLPELLCPSCKSKMKADGFNIPYEEFFGKEGEKPIDLALNVGLNEQEDIYRYIADQFGENRVFHGGLCQTLGEDEAEKYVKVYMNHCENKIDDIKPIVNKLSVKVCNAGSHPAGLYIFPKDVYNYTPVVFPSRDLKAGYLVTHFDSISIMDYFLKIDFVENNILTMIHMLEKTTGVNYEDVPLCDKAAISLFSSPQELGVSSSDILVSDGVNGLPAFSDERAHALLAVFKPENVEDVIRVLGVIHLNHKHEEVNDVINSITLPLKEYPASRGDVFNRLVHDGASNERAYQDMDAISRRSIVKDEVEFTLHQMNLPDWFIQEYHEMRYLFPRSHNVSYAVSQLKLAWYKMYYPKAFYTAWLNIYRDKIDPSDLRSSIFGLRGLLIQLKREKLGNAVIDTDNKDKENDHIAILSVLLEMMTRGIRMIKDDYEKTGIPTFTLQDDYITYTLEKLT